MARQRHSGKQRGRFYTDKDLIKKGVGALPLCRGFLILHLFNISFHEHRTKVYLGSIELKFRYLWLCTFERKKKHATGIFKQFQTEELAQRYRMRT